MRGRKMRRREKKKRKEGRQDGRKGTEREWMRERNSPEDTTIASFQFSFFLSTSGFPFSWKVSF